MGAGLLGWAADETTELTLPQFRAQVRAPTPGPRQREDPAAVAALHQRADAQFFDLLAAQGNEAAARQSLDRLSGWSKAAEARLAAQQLAPLDMELLHFAEAQAAARLSRAEADRRKSLQAANRLLGREPDSPLIVLPNKVASEPSAEAGASKALSDLAKLQSRMEKELLPQASELLGKTYQNYLFGGVPLSDLLWLEERVHEAEEQYQSLVVATEKETASAGPSW